MLMMAGGLNVVVARFGDVLGTNLFDYYGGFAACVIAITVVYGPNPPGLFARAETSGCNRGRPNVGGSRETQKCISGSWLRSMAVILPFWH